MTGRWLTVAILLAASLLAWQLKGLIRMPVPSGSSVMLPGVITLDIGGGTFTCKLDQAAYTCALVQVPVRGTRS